MRGSIKLISLGITLGIFFLLNGYWFIVNPKGKSMDTGNPFYYLALVIIFASILTIGIVFFVKSRQKTKVKL